MVIATNLGFPRIGANRELKKMVENFWSGKLDQKSLLTGAKNIRAEHWKLQSTMGIQGVPSNDFSFYDHVLDHVVLLGVVPQQYRHITDELTQYFAMARGLQKPDEGIDVPAMEMKKWFDTNYHYLVPELGPDQQFTLAANPKALVEYQEALAMGIKTRPVLIGPFTFLHLAKTKNADFDLFSLVDRIVPVYEQLLKQLAAAGVEWVQFDEPILSFDLDVTKFRSRFTDVYGKLSKAAGSSRLLVANYFGRLEQNLEILTNLPVAAVHVDLVRAPEELDAVLKSLKSNVALSVGVINGRNIWKTDLALALEKVKKAVAALGTDRVFVAPSCSLLHSPFSIEAEKKMDARLLAWMSFAKEKLQEIVTISRAINHGESVVSEQLEANANDLYARKNSTLIHDQNVQQEMRAINDSMLRRKSVFTQRYPQQRARLNLPMFPTTTIGSFPQTKEIRVARQKFKKGEIQKSQYDEFIDKEIETCVKLQEEIGLDILVHGESERNDMVEFFGENMKGYVFSENGWVQSYGSRCVKPPIIYGDVSRPKAMTVETIFYAQTKTKRSTKGMLTGPVTMLQWSFVRDDQPRRDTTFQLGLAIRKEVQDLEKAGIKVIQIDEPAIREGLPLRRKDWDTYLQWAVDSFLLSSTGVEDNTQIHSHFCYSDFNDILMSIQRLDADVITIENARSDLKLLEAFKKHRYENAIGPGVYDIHSPRIPSTEEIQKRLKLITQYVKPELLWINPDCGLKTRNTSEVVSSLNNMVSVAKTMRETFNA